MKKYLVALAMFLTVGSTFAQSKNIVPEYVGQVAILNPDSTLTVVTKEAGSIKTKSSKWGMIPIPGTGLLDKSKVNLTIKGTESPTKVTGKVVMIMNAGTNEKDPSNVFGIIKFEVNKKNRTYQMASAGVLSGVDATMSYNSVMADIKKYGTDCYIISFGNLEPGEYGFFTGDISKLATFSVK